MRLHPRHRDDEGGSGGIVGSDEEIHNNLKKQLRYQIHALAALHTDLSIDWNAVSGCYQANKSSMVTSLLTILLPIPLATPNVVTNVYTSDFVV